MMSGRWNARWAERGNYRGTCTRRIFCLFDLCHEIVTLGIIFVSLPAAPTPTYVGSGGEEGDTNDFWDPEFRVECWFQLNFVLNDHLSISSVGSEVLRAGGVEG